MKKSLNPVTTVIAIVAVLAVVGFFLYRAATDMPHYAGENAPHPSPQGDVLKSPEEVKNSTEAFRQGFSGAAPGSKMPSDMQNAK